MSDSTTSGVQAEYKKSRSGLIVAVAALVVIVLGVGAYFLFTGDDDGDDTTAAADVDLSEPFTVAATEIPHADILQFVQDELADEAGLDFEIERFADYPLGNRWLDDGTVDANYFQHQPYFDAQVADFGYELYAFPGVHIEPYAAFSESLDSIADLPEGAEISITNDGSNQARALELLATEDLVGLPDSGDVNIYTIDNPNDYTFTEADPAAQARAVSSVDLAILNGNYFLDAGYSLDDALLVESVEDNPFANFLTVRDGEQDDPRFAKLDELLHSDEVRAFIEETWPGGDVYPAS